MFKLTIDGFLKKLVFHGHPIRYYFLQGKRKLKCNRVLVRKKIEKYIFLKKAKKSTKKWRKKSEKNGEK